MSNTAGSTSYSQSKTWAANELAIACETDEARRAVDRATSDGGLGANIADLQRVVILRD